MKPSTTLLALIVILFACKEPTAERGSGYVQLSVITTGGDQDDSFEIKADTLVFSVGPNGLKTVQLPEGHQSIELRGVADNCIVDGSSTVSVDVQKDEPTRVTFKVVCSETGFIIEARATGGDFPSAFEIQIAQQTPFSLAPNETEFVSRLPAGRYQLRVSTGVSRCAVQGDSVTAVDVINRQMTTVVFNIQCSVRPRPGMIAYVEDQKLVVINTDGTTDGDLPRGWTPSWSRDGTKIVFSTSECDYYTYRCTGSLVTVDQLTREVTPLSGTAFGTQPAWSPTDDIIAYTGEDFGRLFLYKLTTRGLTQISFSGVSWVNHPSWSPDGKQLVLMCYVTNAGPRLCIINRDGTGLRFIDLGGNYNLGEPEWSPDGKQIVFSRYLTGQTMISVVNPDGTGLRDVTAGWNPSWSPDSKQIIFVNSTGILTIDVDGSNLKRLTTGNHYQPAWRR